MRIFLDTANLEEISRAVALGLIDGVTTNPTLLAKAGLSFPDGVLEVCRAVQGPVSLEVTKEDAAGMVEEGRRIAGLAPNLVVKVPVTLEGIQAIRMLAKDGIPVNATLVFQPLQALLAARAGAKYASVFLGRLDDVGHDAISILRECLEILEVYGMATELIAASVRHPLHVLRAALLGTPIVTLPFGVLLGLVEHPLTKSGLERFLQDARSVASSMHSPK